MLRKCFGFLIAGILAGTVTGLLGAGGGILVVLGLRALYKENARHTHAIFASCIAVMLPLSAFSAWQYAQKGGIPAFSPLTLALPAEVLAFDHVDRGVLVNSCRLICRH